MAYLLSKGLVRRILAMLRWWETSKTSEVGGQSSTTFNRVGQIVVGNEIVLAVVQADPTGSTISVKFVGEDRETPYGEAFNVATFRYEFTSFEDAFPYVTDGCIIPITCIQGAWYCAFPFQGNEECA